MISTHGSREIRENKAYPLALDQSRFGLAVRVSILSILIGSYLATVIVNIRDERQLIMNDIKRIIAVSNASASIHVESTFEATAHTLTSLSSDLGMANAERSAQKIIEDHFFSAPFLRAILFADEQGLVVASTFEITVGQTINEYPFFYSHQNASENFVFIGDFIVGETTRAPHFFSSVGRYNEDGDFIGIVAAAYELTYFKNLFEQLTPGDHYGIALFHNRDGLIIADDSDITAGALPTSSQFPSIVPYAGDGATMNLTIPLNGGGSGFTNNMMISNGPFFVSAMADIDKLLANHIRGNFVKYSLSALFVITVITLAVALEVYIVNRRRAEEANALLAIELRQSQKMEALGTLAGGLAHDFNNLLSSIFGYAEIIRDRSEDHPHFKRASEQILLAGRRAESMINRILTFARRGEIKTEIIRIDHVVNEVLELMHVSIQPSVNVTYTIEAREPALWVRGDINQLHQVVMNVCSNALQAMPSGGELEIVIASKTKTVAKNSNDFRAKVKEFVSITISDTGSGIDPKIRDRIFDPFFTTKAVGKGSGLGLSIVHSIVERHRGSIHIDDAPSGGAMVGIWIPAVEKDETVTSDSENIKLNGNGRIAMFVDDDEAIVELTEEKLADFGFEPVGFTDPKEAWASFKERPEQLDLLITDKTMPGMDGLELAELVRELRPEMPIILVTGCSTIDEGAKCDSLNISEIVRKPLRARRLAAAILRALGETQNGSEIISPGVTDHTPP